MRIAERRPRSYLLAFRLDLGRYRFKDTGGSRDTLQYRYHSGVFLPVLYRSVTSYRYPPTTSRQSRPAEGERRCQRGAYRSTTGVARPSQKPTFAPVVGVLYPVRCRECRFSTISENAMRRATLPLAFVPVATAVAAAHAVAKGSIPRLPLFVRARAVPAITAASI